jgi:hypothetical protein
VPSPRWRRRRGHSPENERCHDGGRKTFGATNSHGGAAPHDQPSQRPGQPAKHDPAGEGHERDAQGFHSGQVMGVGAERETGGDADCFQGESDDTGDDDECGHAPGGVAEPRVEDDEQDEKPGLSALGLSGHRRPQHHDRYGEQRECEQGPTQCLEKFHSCRKLRLVR